MCIPYNVIEPIMGMLATQNWFSYQRKGSHEDHLRRLMQNVSNAPVELRVFLAQTTIRLSDLLRLQVGDLITTEREVTEDVLIQVEGKKKFLAQAGQFRGKRAIKLTKIIQQPVETAAETASKAVAGASL